MIDIQGVTIAKLNEKLEIQTLETFFDPMEMFRQIDRENGSAMAAAAAKAAISGCPIAGDQSQNSQ